VKTGIHAGKPRGCGEQATMCHVRWIPVFTGMTSLFWCVLHNITQLNKMEKPNPF
jgi:hypothetical protein